MAPELGCLHESQANKPHAKIAITVIQSSAVALRGPVSRSREAGIWREVFLWVIAEGGLARPGKKPVS